MIIQNTTEKRINNITKELLQLCKERKYTNIQKEITIKCCDTCYNIKLCGTKLDSDRGRITIFVIRKKDNAYIKIESHLYLLYNVNGYKEEMVSYITEIIDGIEIQKAYIGENDLNMSYFNQNTNTQIEVSKDGLQQILYDGKIYTKQEEIIRQSQANFNWLVYKSGSYYYAEEYDILVPISNYDNLFEEGIKKTNECCQLLEIEKKSMKYVADNLFFPQPKRWTNFTEEELTIIAKEMESILEEEKNNTNFVIRKHKNRNFSSGHN